MKRLLDIIRRWRIRRIVRATEADYVLRTGQRWRPFGEVPRGDGW